MTALAERDVRSGPARAGTLRLEALSVELAAPDIVHVVLAADDGSSLPPFAPGSHIVLECGGVQNAYSLVNSGIAPACYEIAVRLDRSGKGGSAFVHTLRPGDVVESTLPRGSFQPVATATKHLLVAGGIGITPILAHARAAAFWGECAEVVYSARPGSAAFVDELTALCEAAGFPLHLVNAPDELVSLMTRLLSSQPVGTHVYTCGPAGMIEAVAERAAGAGWPAARVHSEAFSAGDLDPGEPFLVRLARSGRTVAVPAGVSMLSALEQAGVQTPSLCRTGVCGECRIPVTGGRPLHRDLVLTAAERAEGREVLPCVSRCAGDELEVEL